MFLHVSVILFTGGRTIPACIAGDIPACLAAGVVVCPPPRKQTATVAEERILLECILVTVFTCVCDSVHGGGGAIIVCLAAGLQGASLLGGGSPWQGGLLGREVSLAGGSPWQGVSLLGGSPCQGVSLAGGVSSIEGGLLGRGGSPWQRGISLAEGGLLAGGASWPSNVAFWYWGVSSLLTETHFNQKAITEGHTRRPQQKATPQEDGFCCGWYASYWNAFLFCKMFTFAGSLCTVDVISLSYHQTSFSPLLDQHPPVKFFMGNLFFFLV